MLKLEEQKPFEETRFLTGIPYANDVVPIQFAFSLRELQAPPESRIFATGHTITSAARNIIAQKALQEEYDYIFFMDCDMTFPPDTIKRLWQHNKPVMSGLYKARRGGDGHYFHFKYVPEEDCFVQNDMIQWTLPILQTHGSGGGCLLVNIEVLKILEQPYFWYDDKHPMHMKLQEEISRSMQLDKKINILEKLNHKLNYGYGNGEDLNFFKQCYLKDVDCWIDTSVFCGHYGLQSFGNPYMRKV